MVGRAVTRAWRRAQAPAQPGAARRPAVRPPHLEVQGRDAQVDQLCFGGPDHHLLQQRQQPQPPRLLPPLKGQLGGGVGGREGLSVLREGKAIPCTVRVPAVLARDYGAATCPAPPPAPPCASSRARSLAAAGAGRPAGAAAARRWRPARWAWACLSGAKQCRSVNCQSCCRQQLVARIAGAPWRAVGALSPPTCHDPAPLRAQRDGHLQLVGHRHCADGVPLIQNHAQPVHLQAAAGQGGGGERLCAPHWTLARCSPRQARHAAAPGRAPASGGCSRWGPRPATRCSWCQRWSAPAGTKQEEGRMG